VPDRNGLWRYVHTDGKEYLCTVENITQATMEISWLGVDPVPKGDWSDDWYYIGENGSSYFPPESVSDADQRD